MIPDRKIDMRGLLSEFGVQFRQNKRDWLELKCPFCRDDGTHLGWSGTVFSCYRCGKLNLLDVVIALTGLGVRDAIQKLDERRGKERDRLGPSSPSSGILARPEALSVPCGTGPMGVKHRSYLVERGFDPDELASTWSLMGTGALSPPGLKWRLIIPVEQGGQAVSWQARDITDKAKSRYWSCPDEESVVPIKHCIYGIDKVFGDTVVVVEGPTKVWRLGPGAVASFGSKLTTAQIRLLSKFKRTFILFDRDDAGRSGARQLGNALAALGKEAHVLEISDGPDDPGDFSNKDANQLMKELLSQ